MFVVKYRILYCFVLFELIIKNLLCKSILFESLKYNVMVEFFVNKK